VKIDQRCESFGRIINGTRLRHSLHPEFFLRGFMNLRNEADALMGNRDDAGIIKR
jgi:hypothetical protein